MDYIYRFPVVKGVQACSEYYIAMVPLKMLEKIFPTDEEFVLPEFRAQRKLNGARIPVISKYILDNRESYVFSALAASIDGEFCFEPNLNNPDTGLLDISMSARFLINDGQHRKTAILEAIKEDSSLGDETIPIVFFADKGLSRSQQMFTDLNKNAVKTSNSISELYDSRDNLAVVTRNVVNAIDFYNMYTDKEKDILGKFSSSLFTLNTFYTANRIIVGRSNAEDYSAFLIEFWTLVAKHMRPWVELQNREITKVDLRENYIATQSIVIQAFGRIGNYYCSSTECMKESMKNIESINWMRSAECWNMRAIGKNGRIITNKKAGMLIANYIKLKIGIPLTPEEKQAEIDLKMIV